jgi:hypothetical protein
MYMAYKVYIYMFIYTYIYIVKKTGEPDREIYIHHIKQYCYMLFKYVMLLSVLLYTYILPHSRPQVPYSKSNQPLSQINQLLNSHVGELQLASTAPAGVDVHSPSSS